MLDPGDARPGDNHRGRRLVGAGGDAFVEAIPHELIPAITKLSNKFDEVAKDVGMAVKYMQEADRTSKAQFN